MEQMVFAEATLALPLIAGDAYHRRHWESRVSSRFTDRLDEALVALNEAVTPEPNPDAMSGSRPSPRQNWRRTGR